uniref:WD40/YVTN/BNR-like repeat-containing protein n=1 Tax=Roseivirga sp. TaxID=1964215 RepID=UPI0040485611
MTKNMKIASFMLVIIGLSTHFSQAQKIPTNVADKIYFRQIGPTRQGGRYVDFAIVDEATKVIYAATASGGVWKTVNNGISWESIFDNESIISVGAVAVDQQDTSTVWVGSGEANNSRSSYWGNGVYKSTNGGKTWTNMGLPESHHIGRILIDPNNSNTVYVAALGHLYSDNPERGLYKTTNGGKTWSKVLEVKKADGKFIGVVDVSMDPKDPNTLVAAAYDKIRTPWTFNEGGEGSGIYKSTDAGKTWKKLGGGLPTGFLGRIGVAHAPNNPKVVYANIENVNVDGVSVEERRKMLETGIPLKRGQSVKGVEMYRSADGGETWAKISPDGVDIGGAPSYYYQQVRVDP